MNRYLLSVLIIFSTASTFSQKLDPSYQKLLSKVYDGFPTISVQEAEKKLAAGSYIFLDAREKSEYYVSHIPKAIWIGYDDFHIEKLSSIDRSKPVIIYCSIGARSQSIGKILVKNGFKQVYNLYGGIFQWANEAKPLVDANENPTSSIHGYNAKWSKWIKKGNIIY